MQEPSVCIIGAGSSGIAACKTFQEKNIDFDCYESGSQIGGNWRYQNDNGMSSAYRSLHINTSKKMMAYSDFPMPEDYPHFPHHSQIIRYFEDYVNHYNFKDKIHFQNPVTNLKPDKSGGFWVESPKLGAKKYDTVVVANGHHWQARLPEPPFPGHFDGASLHSHDYKTPDILMNKNVLIVGIGNSAVDIACEAARLHTGRVSISTRSGAYIMPNYLLGRPFDEMAKDIPYWLPMSMLRKILNLSLWLARGSQESYGIPKPKRKLLSEHPTVSQDLPNLVGRGLIDIKPNIKELAGKEVIFEDGTNASYDIIIYCTGYKISFPFFDPEMKPFVQAAEDNDLQLYRRVIHPDYPGLYFLGLIQPLGAIMPLAELQAKWIAQILNNEVVLPSPDFMYDAIEKEKDRVAKRYIDSKRHTIQVDFMEYKALIEREMKQMKNQ
ncbi:MAG: NAD(P)-binding domain-containing protein [Bacteroidota bacterium]